MTRSIFIRNLFNVTIGFLTPLINTYTFNELSKRDFPIHFIPTSIVSSYVINLRAQLTDLKATEKPFIQLIDKLLFRLIFFSYVYVYLAFL